MRPQSILCSRLASVVLAIVVPASVSAQTINRAPTGLASPATTITFEGQINNAPAATVYSGSGVTFGPNLYFTNSAYFAGSGGGGGALANFFPCCTTPVDLFFDHAVSGSAFQFITNPGTTTFTAFLNGSQVATLTAATDLAGEGSVQFYGFDESVALDRIEISTPVGNPGLALDNFQIGQAVTATPEPASLVLLATGLAGVFGTARGKRGRSSPS